MECIYVYICMYVMYVCIYVCNTWTLHLLLYFAPAPFSLTFIFFSRGHPVMFEIQ